MEKAVKDVKEMELVVQVLVEVLREEVQVDDGKNQ